MAHAKFEHAGQKFAQAKKRGVKGARLASLKSAATRKHTGTAEQLAQGPIASKGVAKKNSDFRVYGYILR